MADHDRMNLPASSGEQYALLTDIYELTMAAGYFAEERHGEATFSLFIRLRPTRCQSAPNSPTCRIEWHNSSAVRS